MRLELWIIGIVLFLSYNIYDDFKLYNSIFQYKKYFQMGLIVIGGIMFYTLIKNSSTDSESFKNVIDTTSKFIQYAPIDKNSKDILTPFLQNINKVTPTRMLSSGGSNKNKRSVSDSKKKYIASNQEWNCGNCGNKLTYTFEIDHKIPLYSGGDNSVSNLIALCRECHGQKTIKDKILD